jgi:hypothetical protein
VPRKNLLAALAIILIVSGCATAGPAALRLPLPPPLVLPTIPAASLECLADDTYDKLVERDVRQRERIHTLEDIIRATSP